MIRITYEKPIMSSWPKLALMCKDTCSPCAACNFHASLIEEIGWDFCIQNHDYFFQSLLYHIPKMLHLSWGLAMCSKSTFEESVHGISIWRIWGIKLPMYTIFRLITWLAVKFITRFTKVLFVNCRFKMTPCQVQKTQVRTGNTSAFSMMPAHLGKRFIQTSLMMLMRHL